jgi:hypothetical protein
VTDGYYRGNKELPNHTEISILDASVINNDGNYNSKTNEEEKYGREDNINPLSNQDDYYRP